MLYIEGKHITTEERMRGGRQNHTIIKFSHFA